MDTAAASRKQNKIQIPYIAKVTWKLVVPLKVKTQQLRIYFLNFGQEVDEQTAVWSIFPTFLCLND